jgi:hypothetical protein
MQGTISVAFHSLDPRISGAVTAAFDRDIELLVHLDRIAVPQAITAP